MRQILQWLADVALRRRKRDAVDGIADMDQRLLEDIGAPHWLIARAASRADARYRLRFELEARP